MRRAQVEGFEGVGPSGLPSFSAQAGDWVIVAINPI